MELNRLTKALFLAQVVLSVVMVALQGFLGPWFRNLFRFVVLFSYIIPIRYSAPGVIFLLPFEHAQISKRLKQRKILKISEKKNLVNFLFSMIIITVHTVIHTT